MIFRIPPLYQLHLFQAEGYEIKRYVRLLWRKGWIFSRQPLRTQLRWTAKSVSLALLALLLHLLLPIVLVVNGSVWSALFLFIVGSLVYPFFFIVGHTFLWPADTIIKRALIRSARRIIANAQNLTIIGIAGSYGKTTMKQVIAASLSTAQRILATPASVNTPVGIAAWLQKSWTPDTEILIIELGEHAPGDVRELCRIAPPTIAVLTGINEAHAERMGSLQQAAATIFEATEHLPENGSILANGDDPRLRAEAKNHTAKAPLLWYGSAEGEANTLPVKRAQFHPDTLTWDCSIGPVERVDIPLLGAYAVGDAMAAIIIGEKLGLTVQDLKTGLASLAPIPHRLEPIRGNGDILIIDDSYNGNPDGVREAIAVLKRFSGRRKLFLTPGLVEMGAETERVHTNIGRELAAVADLVILIRTSVTPFIADGLEAAGFNPQHIHWFATAPEAHAAIRTILEPHDVIVFQNDWGDQYL